MFDKSEAKQKIIKELTNWNYMGKKATIYNIALKIEMSESIVTKILRYLKDKDIVDSSKGSWYLK